MNSYQKKVMALAAITSIGIAGWVGSSNAAQSPDPAGQSGPVIRLEPDGVTNPLGTSHTVTAETLRMNNGTLTQQPNKLVTFTILSGPNDDQVSDPDAGECSDTTGDPDDCQSSAPDALVSWTYTSNGQAGQDVIQACFTEDSGNPNTPGDDSETACVTVTKTWADGPSR